MNVSRIRKHAIGRALLALYCDCCFQETKDDVTAKFGLVMCKLRKRFAPREIMFSWALRRVIQRYGMNLALGRGSEF